MYSIMDKLGSVREAMAQKDDDWEEWGLEALVENLRKYTDQNSLLLVEFSPLASVDTVPGNKDSLQKGRQIDDVRGQLATTTKASTLCLLWFEQSSQQRLYQSRRYSQ